MVTPRFQRMLWYFCSICEQFMRGCVDSGSRAKVHQSTAVLQYCLCTWNPTLLITTKSSSRDRHSVGMSAHPCVARASLSVAAAPARVDASNKESATA